MTIKPTQNKFLLIVFLLSVIIGCKKTEKKANAVETDEKLYEIENIELNEIPDSTYTMNSVDGNSITFNKSLKNSTTTISVRVFEENKFNDAHEFIDFAEDYIEKKMESYEMKSLHYNVVGFKNTTCFKFDGTYRDTTNLNTNKEFLSQDGYLCLVPNNESKIAEIKVVHYSTEKLMPNDVIYQFQNMVEQLKFTQK